MNLNFLSNSVVSFSLGQEAFNLEFISAPSDFIVQKNDNNLVLNVRKDITAVVEANETSLVLNLNKNLSYTVSFAIKFLGASFIKINDRKLQVNDSFVLDIDFGAFNFNDNGTVLIKVLSNNSKLKLYPKELQEEVKSLSFEAMTSPSGLPTISLELENLNLLLAPLIILMSLEILIQPRIRCSSFPD